MMFFQLLSVAVAIVAAGQVLAYPMPMPALHELYIRQLGSVDTIPAYKRSVEPSINTVPVDQPSMSINGEILPFVNNGKRAVAVNTVPVEQPSMSVNGEILPFVNNGKRALAVNTVPVDQPSMSINGEILPFVNNGKRALAVNTVPVEQPSMSVNGNIVPFSNTGAN